MVDITSNLNDLHLVSDVVHRWLPSLFVALFVIDDLRLVLPHVALGLSEGVHESAQPHICFVNFCTQIKEDLLSVTHCGPDVRYHVRFLDVVGNHEHLAAFLLIVEKDIHRLDVALSDECLPVSSFTTLSEKLLLEISIGDNVIRGKTIIVRIEIVEM